MTSATAVRRGPTDAPDRWTVRAGALQDVPAVRHHVMARLRELLGADADLDAADLDSVELVVGELVGNAVAHTEGPAWVSLHRERQGLRLRVADTGPHGWPDEVTGADPWAEHGRGLFLVRQLAHDLDVRPRPGGGTVVSVRLAVPAGSSPATMGR